MGGKKPFVFSTVPFLWEKNFRKNFHHLKKIEVVKKERKKIQIF
jgi:hypothetical protein